MTTAVVLEAALMRGDWAPVLPVTVAVLVAFLAAGARYPAAAAVVVLLFTYAFPALVFLLRGRFVIGYATVWVAALTADMAQHELRVPTRAARFGWPYGGQGDTL
jgi:hypothetical protein